MLLRLLVALITAATDELKEALVEEFRRDSQKLLASTVITR